MNMWTSAAGQCQDSFQANEAPLHCGWEVVMLSDDCNGGCHLPVSLSALWQQPCGDRPALAILQLTASQQHFASHQQAGPSGICRFESHPVGTTAARHRHSLHCGWEVLIPPDDCNATCHLPVSRASFCQLSGSKPAEIARLSRSCTAAVH